MPTPNDVLSIARKEIGYSRWSDPEPGSKYGRWYAKDHGSYYGESGVPYCAMFVSWVFAHAGQSCPGLPGAYCPYIERDGKKAGIEVSKTEAKPGDVVLFDWGHDKNPDHVGIIEANNGSYLTTIEGNTSGGSKGSQGNGGVVARRTRSYGVVCCVLRPPYSKEEKVTEAEMDKIAEKAAAKVWQYNLSGKGVQAQDRVYGTDVAANTAKNQLTRTDDPSGRNQHLNDHDHIKWIAAKQAAMDEKLDAILKALKQ